MITSPLPHYLTITSPLPHHYLTITSPLPHHYLTITSLPHHYLTITSPLPHHYLTITDLAGLQLPALGHAVGAVSFTWPLPQIALRANVMLPKASGAPAFVHVPLDHGMSLTMKTDPAYFALSGACGMPASFSSALSASSLATLSPYRTDQAI
jgi:hypothetical protein